MGTNVKANGMAVACKAASGKSMCCLPDVCFTPPENIITPPGIPIPYPNTAGISDMTSGSKDVKIKGEEIALKDTSYIKETKGDEAGSAAKKGVITSNNTGAAYFVMYSTDVKVEGENVDRSLDLMTHNHASIPGNTPPWPYVD